MPKTNTNLSTYTSMMRVTSHGRPYTKDLYDMFAAVLLQIQLSDHRVMFRTYPNTFTTEEACKVMANLVFTHIHRQSDPADPARQIATRTTTTFSMDSTSAKTLIQQFLHASLIMNASDPNSQTVRDKGMWGPTIKGKYVLEEFAESSQVDISSSLRDALKLLVGGGRVIVLDRLQDDQITFSRPNITAIFKAMTHALPREALIPEEFGGIEKKQMDIYQYTFLAVHCIEWMCERLTVNSSEEAESVASEFVLFGWLAQVLDKSDKSHTYNETDYVIFNTSRNSIYYVTERGCEVIGWKTASSNSGSSSNSVNSMRRVKVDSGIEPSMRPASMSITDSALSHASKESSQWAKLTQILETPLMRMYFRDFLRSNFCVENINFWVEHQKLLKNAENKDVVDRLSECYIIYETYIGSLNIDHTLHHDIVKYVTHVLVEVNQVPPSTPYFVAPIQQSMTTNTAKPTKNRLLLAQTNTKQKVVMIRGGSPEKCLSKILSLFAKVNDHVCLMMAEDSVPKFVKTEQYKELVLKLQRKKEEQEQVDEEESEDDYEDSDEDEKGKLTTSFSDQRSIMVRHKPISAMNTIIL